MRVELRYGKRIREERLKRGWTQEHLAEIAGVASRTIARVEKDEVRGLDSLMAIAAAFEKDLRELVQMIRIAEAKPTRSLLIRRAEDLGVAFNRAHHSGLYRTLLLPLRADLVERTEELLETIFADLPYLSADEPELVRCWVKSSAEPLEELRSMGMEIVTIQDCREGFIGKAGQRKLLENWTIGYHLLVLEHSCFSIRNCVHRFHEGCAVAVRDLHEWLRQEQDGVEIDMCLFVNELIVAPVKGVEQQHCNVCFPNGPTADYLTEEYMKRISGLSAEQLRSLLETAGSSRTY